MTLDTFAKRTGWPREELAQLRIFSELLPLLGLYGLELAVKIGPTRFRWRSNAWVEELPRGRK